MKKIAFSLIVGALFLGNSSHLHAQILNGSFTTGDFTDWNTVGGSSGGPQVVMSGPTPPLGITTQAFVQSTDADFSLSISASAATLDAALGVTLPSTTNGGNFLYPPGPFSPTNGQAIYQTFSVGAQATLSFAYSFQTNDYFPYDSTGYVLDGVYTQLASPPPFGTPSPDSAPGFAYGTPYTTLSLMLNPGTHTFGFVAYNTNDEYSSSALYVTDVSATTPEPREWQLMLLGCAGLLLARKFRSKLSAI